MNPSNTGGLPGAAIPPPGVRPEILYLVMFRTGRRPPTDAAGSVPTALKIRFAPSNPRGRLRAWPAITGAAR
jgi:hypothetical protein